jgi:hypothetical protein
MMAELLDDFDWSQGRRSIYPWETWFDGRVWKLHSGKDFQGPASRFQTNLYSHPVASRRGLKVRSSIVDDNKALVIQAYKP